jgi:hypothetical protein
MRCCFASSPDLRLFLPPLRPSLSRKQSVVAAYGLIPLAGQPTRRTPKTSSACAELRTDDETAVGT